MKFRTLLAIGIFTALISCQTTKNSEFLFLNAKQLNSLGIELNANGVFYKNFNPNWKESHEKYSCLGFYSSNNDYLKTFHYAETDTLKPSNGNDSLLFQKELSHNDFYPLIIGNTQGQQSLDNKTLPLDMKLLPVAICMSETKLSNRNDTLIVWFKSTAALKKALPKDIKMEDYLKTRPVKK
ncbi:MAG: hypothetical protein Q8928_11745 [Bacteroidota bacterium]|nr:hypothetical protein [Bacteroidota bacterium]